VFAGRSGWCGTFCPLGPIQRTYGHAPLVVVPNGYCPTCVGCQKNCYDFNPRGAIFADLVDSDPRYAGQRRLFIGLLPGLIGAYFLQGPTQTYGYELYLAILLGSCCASAGLYAIATSCFPALAASRRGRFRRRRTGHLLLVWRPDRARTLAYFLSFAAPEWLIAASRGVGVIGGLVLLVSSLYAEGLFKKASSQTAAAAPEPSGKTQMHTRFGGKQGAEVTDRETKVAFPVAKGATLLDAIESAGLKINYGCRAGLCGADAVVVCAGSKHLSAGRRRRNWRRCADSASKARRGWRACAGSAARCSSTAIRTSATPSQTRSSPRRAGRGPCARWAGVSRVVIIGNGIAGTSAAEQLRRLSASLQIDMISSEPLHFYNRMAIGRLIYGRTGMDGLQLIPDNWYARNRVEVWRNSIARSVDRQHKTVLLATGESLPYDKLILATGAHCTTPDPDFLSFDNAFVLRSAEDAQALRNHVQLRRARRALVVGGGVLGVEAADALHHLGLQVTLLQRSDRLMNAQLDHQGAARLAAYLEGIGIQVLTDVAMSAAGKARARRCAPPGWRTGRAPGRICSSPAWASAPTRNWRALPVWKSAAVSRWMPACAPATRTSTPSATSPNCPAPLAACGPSAPPRRQRPPAHCSARAASPTRRHASSCSSSATGSTCAALAKSPPSPATRNTPRLPNAAAWWRLILRQGVLVGAIYVGPPRSAKDFTRVVQAGVDLTPIRADLRRGDLSGLAKLNTD
jgi:nitrite reductase (NADH) large subunit